MSDFKNVLKSTGSRLQLNMSDAPRQQLPPASLQTFMKERSNISGLIITNHEKEFINRYFYVSVGGSSKDEISSSESFSPINYIVGVCCICE